jgi:hypothetical protein
VAAKETVATVTGMAMAMKTAKVTAGGGNDGGADSNGN